MLLLQVPPIVPTSDLALADRLDGAVDTSVAADAGAAAAASLVRTLRSWSHDRTDSVNTAQEALALRAQQAEQAAVDALRGVTRAEAHARALAADLMHGASPLHVRCVLLCVSGL